MSGLVVAFIREILWTAQVFFSQLSNILQTREYSATRLLVFPIDLLHKLSARVTISIKLHDYVFSEMVTLGEIFHWSKPSQPRSLRPSKEGVDQ